MWEKFFKLMMQIGCGVAVADLIHHVGARIWHVIAG